MIRALVRWILFAVWLWCATGAMPVWAADSSQGRTWDELLAGATRLHLPTKFLKAMPAEFVRFEFDDLRTYAAEYHPGEHRMVLNRPLSFNAAGVTLRPLTGMTPKELEVLYHELFHAYIDYLVSKESEVAPPDSLLVFARAQQACRYEEVAITPVVQRPQETEVRYLTEGEAWEALNETWAVFVGWTVWTQLEVQKKQSGPLWQQPRQMQVWQKRLEQAIKQGELRGYYVPADPDERRVTQKRFLASTVQISTEEIALLMRQVLGLPNEIVVQSKNRIEKTATGSPDRSCEGAAIQK